MQESVCSMCEQPIWSFVCASCVAKEVKGWLPEGLRPPFESFTAALSRTVPQRATLEHCVKCTRLVRAPVCLFCYIGQVQHWLQPRNPDMAETLFRTLPPAHQEQTQLKWREPAPDRPKPFASGRTATDAAAPGGAP